MAKRDINFDKIEEKRIQKHEILDNRKRKESQRKIESSYQVQLISDSSCDEHSDLDDIEFEVDKSTEHSKCPKKRVKNVVNSTLTSVLDRANISNRNATFVLAAVAQSVGQDLTSIALNRESIRRARRQQR